MRGSSPRMTSGIVDMPSHSRDTLRPKFSFRFALAESEGAGNAGCALHPRSHAQVCTRKCAHEHTGEAENIRHSLRNGFTAYNALSPENGSFASVAPRELLPPGA